MININNKDVAINKISSGVLGNHLRIWESVSAASEDIGYEAICTLRYKSVNVGGSSYCHYNVSVSEAKNLIDSYVASERAVRERFFINESPDNSLMIIQGEVQRSYRGVDLWCSVEKLPMRQALENGKSFSGVSSIAVLRRHLSPSSFDDLLELLDKYDNHVVEFGTYSYNLGNIKGRNTVIWEVRNY